MDWAASRLELERYLREQGVGSQIFLEIPKGNLPLYEALRARLLDGKGQARGDCATGGMALSDRRELLQRASTIIEAHELRGVERARETPGAMALVRRLWQRGKAVAIVTSNSSRTVRRWLERNQLSACIDLIVGRDAQLPLKPAPDSIRLALQRFSATAADSVFVGDSLADAEAAGRAQVRFAGIAGSHEKRERLREHGAIWTFESPAVLAEVALFGHSELSVAEKLV